MVNREQRTFASTGFDVYRRPMRRAEFPREMNQAMPWASTDGPDRAVLSQGRATWPAGDNSYNSRLEPSDETTILRRNASIRCQVEHVFGLIKHVFGWRKVRFRGIDKNLQYAFGVAAAVNAYLHRRALLRKMAGHSPG